MKVDKILLHLNRKYVTSRLSIESEKPYDILMNNLVMVIFINNFVPITDL